MGKEYFYCVKCQKRLDSDELAAGRGVEVLDKIACDACVADVMAPLGFREQEQILLKLRLARESAPARPDPRPAAVPQPPRSGGQTSARLRTITPPRAMRSAPAPSGGGGFRLTLLLILLAVAGTAAFLHYSGDSRDDAPVAASSRPAAAPPPARPAAPLATMPPAKVKENPATPEVLQKRQKETIAADLIALDAENRPALDREEYAKAIDRIEQARPRHSAAEWTNGLEMRIRDIHLAAWKVFTPLRDKALDARKRGAQDEIRSVTDRVAKWGLPKFQSELEGSLAAGANPAPATPSTAPAPAPEAKPVSEEARTYLNRWQEAMNLAGARDFDAALRLLDTAASAVQDAALKDESRSDIELLRAVASLHREAALLLRKWPKGERINLEYFDDTASLEKVAAPFRRADDEGVEVAPGGVPLQIEHSEIAARTLGALFNGRPGKADGDARTAAAACLLEGDAVGARTHLAGPAESIPWKYWSLSARVEEIRLNPATEAGKKAIAARKLYFLAEREHREMKTRGTSIEKYRALLNEYADAPIVRQKRARISERRETAKEYVYLAPDLATSGAFKAANHSKVGHAWVSAADVDAKKGGKNNWVEFEFYALQDTPYRCWIMAGGCCQEVFACSYQATDLTVPHPQTKEKLPVDPGGDLHLELKNTITFLKPRHESHGGPKEAKRWEWMAVPLPKYPTAGLKRVRLITDQKGFGIAWAAVSATKNDPPRDSEMKELLKARQAPEEDPAPIVAAAGKEPEKEKEPERDPSLVGHWRLDDAGGSIVDSSGHDNTGVATGQPERVQGKLGGAFALDGKDKFVSIPNSPNLEKLQEGSYTVSAWFRPSAVPAAGGSFAIVGKSEKFAGLRYTADQKFAMDHWLAGDASASAVSAATFAPNTFYHVAGIVNRADGMVAVYVNGKLEGTANFAPNSAAKEFGTETWKIGLAALGRWAAQGVVDDVRLYARAIPVADLKALYDRATAAR